MTLQVLLCQNEITPVATIAALALARDNNVFRLAHSCAIHHHEVSRHAGSILNLAPAVKDAPSEFLTLPSVLCVNESEAEILTGIHVANKAVRACNL